MNWLLDIFKGVRGTFFDEGRAFHRFEALFDALENIFFGPSVTTRVSPHVRDPLDVKRFMTTVIVALLPAVACAWYFYGLRIFAMILVSYMAGGAVEMLFAVVRKEEVNEGFLVTGLIFPLILPPGLPLWMVAVGIMFGVFVGKELFGGTGRNLFNPALVGRCFLALGYPAAMSANWIKAGASGTGRLLQYVDSCTVDAVSQATPLVLAKQGNLASAHDLLVGTVSGSAGETSFLAILVGGLFLLATRVANWRTVLSSLGFFALVAAFMHYLSPDRFAPAGWHLCAGGLMFGAFFMATDPVSSPVTNVGKWIYGLLIGLTTWLIRNLTGYVEGVMFAILLGNIVAPVLDEIVFSSRKRRLAREG